VTNATRQQEEAVNLQGLFASHRELEQKKKKLPLRWPARNHGRVREEWRTKWHVGVPIKTWMRWSLKIVLSWLLKEVS